MDATVSWQLVAQWEPSRFQQWVGFPAVERVPAMGRFVEFARENGLDHLPGVRAVKTTEMGKTNYRVSDPTWVMQNTLYQGLVWALSKPQETLEEALMSATARLNEFTLLTPLVVERNQYPIVHSRNVARDLIKLVGELAEDGTRIQIPIWRDDGHLIIRRFWRTSL